MAAITLQNIPDTLHARLEYPAKVLRRSLNSEIISNSEGPVGIAEVDTQSRNGQLAPSSASYPVLSARIDHLSGKPEHPEFC